MFSLCVCLCSIDVQCPQRPEEGVGFPGTGAVDSCELQVLLCRLGTWWTPLVTGQPGLHSGSISLNRSIPADNLLVDAFVVRAQGHKQKIKALGPSMLRQM